MSRCDSVFVDGIGKILVAQEVLDDYPQSHSLWAEIGFALKVFLDAVSALNHENRRNPFVDNYFRHYGVPNSHLRLSLVTGYDLDDLHEDQLWIELVVSSIHGEETGRLLFVRRDPPDYWYENSVYYA